MAGMALQAEKGLTRLQQRVIGGTMRRMAVGAVLRHVGMFVNKGPLIFHVAAGTGFLDGYSAEVLVVRRPVRIVAVGTGHFVFRHRMMGELVELRLYFLVTFEAKVGHFMAADLLLRSLMEGVTIKTADVVCGMDAAVPVVQGGDGCRGMALQADQGLGLGRKFLQGKQGFKFASPFFFGVFHSQAPRPMAGFTIDQRQTGLGFDLLAVNRMLKILVDLIVFVAFGQAGLVSDVVGVETANDQSFILFDGADRLVGTEG